MKFLLILIWAVFIGSSQAQPPLLTPQQELAAWDVVGLGRSLEFYKNCKLSTRCMGLPEGCIGRGNCDAFIEISPPDVIEELDIQKRTNTFEFKMFLRLPDDHIQTDVNQYVGLGLNKQSQVMAGAFVIICYFSVLKDTSVNQIFHGWTTNFREVIPIKSQASQIPGAIPFTSIVFERSDAGRIMKCGFNRSAITTITIDENLHPTEARDVNGKSLGTYDLSKESFHLLMAVGGVELDTNSGEPTFKAHSQTGKTSERKQKIQFSDCDSGSLCLGIGSDGCHHSEQVPCSSLMNARHPFEITNLGLEEVYVLILASMVSNGFIGFFLARTKFINSTFLFYGCETNKPAPTVFTLRNCISQKSSSIPGVSEVICDPGARFNPFIEGPFFLIINGTRTSVQPTLTNFVFPNFPPFETFCFGVYDYQEMDFFGLFSEEFYITLFSSNDSNGDFRNLPKNGGKVIFELSDNNTLTTIRSRRKYFLNQTVNANEFDVFPDPRITSTVRPIGVGGFNDSRATTITNTIRGEVSILMIMMMMFLLTALGFLT